MVRVRALAFVLLALVSQAAAIAAVGFSTEGAASAAPPPGGAYMALASPTRVIDTRTGLGGTTLSAGATLNFTVPTSLVPSGSLAVVVNVTVTNTQAPGYLTAWPQGTSQPNTSVLNWLAGQTVADLATIPISSANGLSFYNGSPGAMDLVVDLEGYYAAPSASTGGSGHFYPLPPYRIADTRPGTASNYAGQTLGYKGNPQQIAIAVGGSGGVPATGVSAVLLNVTVTDTSAWSYLTVWPAGASQPLASNLNWAPGQTVANRVQVGLGANSSIALANAFGTADVVVDVVGYFSSAASSSTQGDVFVPLGSPARLLDTRNGTGGITGPLPSDASVSLVAAGQAGLPAPNSPTPPDAIVGTLTGLSPTSAGDYLTLYPSGSAPPVASDVNLNGFEPVANMIAASLSSGSLKIFNAYGGAQAIIDVTGYFTPAAQPGILVFLYPTGPTTIPANGSASVSLYALVTDVSGAPVSNAVAVSTSGAACGAASTPAPVATGSWQFSYTAGTTTGTCLVTIQTTGTPLADQSVAITQVAPVGTVTISPSAPSLVANGTSTVTVNVGLTDSTGAPASGTVNLVGTGSPSNSACGTFPSSVAVSAGSATFTYQSSSTVGVCVISATASAAQGAQMALAQTPAVPSSAYSVSAGAPTTNLVLGSLPSTGITVSVTNGNGAAVAGDPVGVAENGACAPLSTASSVTDQAGKAFYLYTASSAGSCNLTFTEAQTGGSVGLTIGQSYQESVTVVAAPRAVVAGSTTPVSVSAVLANSAGPLAGEPVSVTTSGACGAVATIPQSSAFPAPLPPSTDSQGRLELTVVPGASAGFCLVQVTDTVTNVANSATIVVTPSQPATYDFVQVSPGSASLNTQTTQLFAIHVVSLSGTPVSGDKVQPATTGGPACGSFSPVPNSAGVGVTDSNGNTAFTYASTNVGGPCGITFYEQNTGAVGLASVTSASPVGRIGVSVGGSSFSFPLAQVSAGAVSVPVVVKATFSDGLPMVGASVQIFPVSLKPNTACGSLGAGTGTTNGDGVFATTYSAGDVGFCGLLVTVGALSTQELIVQKAPYASSTSFTVREFLVPPQVAADGVSQVSVGVGVSNSAGQPVANDPVLVLGPSLVLGLFPNCGSMLNGFFGTQVVPGSTDANGFFSTPYRASTVPTTCGFLVLEADTGQGGLVVLQQVINPTPPTGVTVKPMGTSAGLLEVPVSTSLAGIAVQVVDGSNNPVGGDNVSVVSATPSPSGACGVITNYIPLTDSSGTAQFFYSSTATSGFCTVVFQENDTGATGTLIIIQEVQGASSSYSVGTSYASGTLSVSVTNGNGIGVGGDPVLVVPDPVCGSSTVVNPSTGTTSQNPLGTFSATISGQATGCVVTVYEANTGGSATQAA
jgi:hypothetical protein